MSDTMAVTLAFATLVDWVLSTGQERVDLLPDLWHGETDQWRVTLNGSRTETRDDLPPMTFRLIHKTALIGVAVINPFGGAVAGVTEEELIEHFEAATKGRAQ